MLYLVTMKANFSYGDYIYVPYSYDVRVVSSITNDQTEAIELSSSRNSFFTAISPNKEYVMESVGGNVFFISVATNEVVSTYEHTGSAMSGVFNSAGTVAYIALDNGSPGAVLVIDIEDIENPQLITSIATVTAKPTCITITPDDSDIYVSFFCAGKVERIDIGTNVLVGTPTTVASCPVGLTSNSDGSKIYVPSVGDGGISIIDSATNTVTNTISSCSVVREQLQ